MWGFSLAVQWLWFHASTSEDLCLIPSQRTKIPHGLWCFQKIKNKQTKDFHVRPETIKFLNENMFWLHWYPLLVMLMWIWLQRQWKRSNNKQMGLHQAKKFWIVKENISKQKVFYRMWEDIYRSYIQYRVNI